MNSTLTPIEAPAPAAEPSKELAAIVAGLAPVLGPMGQVLAQMTPKQQATGLVAAMGDRWQPPADLPKDPTWDQLAVAAHRQAKPGDYRTAIESHQREQARARTSRTHRTTVRMAGVER